MKRNGPRMTDGKRPMYAPVQVHVETRDTLRALAMKLNRTMVEVVTALIVEEAKRHHVPLQKEPRA